MPAEIIKNCVLCGNWIKRSRRKRNCLCLRCIDKINREWYERRKKRDAHL